MPQGLGHFLTAAERQRLGRLLLLSRYVVEGNLAGAHRSPQRGASSEFADHRAYIPGDDPKHIDWKVLGRTDRYYVRRYEDETNLRVYLVLDRSASMAYGSRDVTKFAYACHLAAALGYVVVKARDSVGLYLHADRIDAIVPPSNTFLHLNNLSKVMQAADPGDTTRIAATLHQIAASIRKRALVVVISDLLDEPDDVAMALSHFRKHHHDVILFQVLDPEEIDFTFRRGLLFEDMESGQEMTADPLSLAADYRQVFGEFLDTYRQRCAELNVDHRIVRTDETLETFVRAYLEERRRLSK